MKKLTAILSVLFLTAFTPPAHYQEKELTFKLTRQEAETVLKGLTKLPYEESAPLIQKIQGQGQKQLTDTTTKKK